MTQEKVVATIDLSHGSLESYYISRLIWRELFNVYRKNGGDLARMDNLLCDLGTLRLFCEGRRVFGGPYSTRYSTLYWEFGVRGFTDLQSFATSPGSYKIEWPIGSDKITISHTPCQLI